MRFFHHGRFIYLVPYTAPGRLRLHKVPFQWYWVSGVVVNLQITERSKHRKGKIVLLRITSIVKRS